MRAALKRSDSDILRSYVQEADEVFNGNGTGLAFGFIDSPHNLPPDIYGWSSLYYPLTKIRKRIDRQLKDGTESMLDTWDKTILGLRGVKRKESKLWLYDHNLIDEEDLMAWFTDLVWRQNHMMRTVTKKTENGTRTYTVDLYGRWSKRKPWGYQVRKALKGALETIENPLLLSLSTYQPRVEAYMDKVIVDMGTWVSTFLKKLRKYQEHRHIEWRYIGWVLEFQDNGFPHAHIILAGDWIGSIKEIAALWPWSESQGVDYMNRAKLRRKLGYNVEPVRLENYLAAYVAKGGQAVVNPGDKYKYDRKTRTWKIWEGEKSVHKCYAWLAFAGGEGFLIWRMKNT
jgi:hypothetical protein